MIRWPSREDPCYDCGSTVHGHHTISCDLAEEFEAKDLPVVPGTQYWTECYKDGKSVPPKLRPETI